MRTVRVEGRGFRPYEVQIGPGLLARAGETIRPLLARPRVAVVADARVAELHGPALAASLAAAGIVLDEIRVPPGEASKSFAELERVCDALLALDLDRKDLIVAFGGGVVGDLTGFAASIYKRGIDFIQIPTTLLAQVDSSVGGKTAIDTPRGKNLIGAFHQPRLVLCDLDVLSTLPDRDLRAGYAEVLKYGLLGDAAFFDWLSAEGDRVLARAPDAVAHAVARSVEMKAKIVGQDERESGRRALLNLGHTFGHALEAEVGFGDALLHGEAVALGCAQAFRFSARLGLCSEVESRRVEAFIHAAGLPTRLDQVPGGPFPVSRLLAHMRQDKKAEGGAMVFVLARGIGRAEVVKSVDAEAMAAFLREEGAAP
jgi:3-dehydroquinate synthase